ncbi:DUF1523 family protein [Rhodophyticola sp. CCM32]|uniref:DUF1523 family protein n=1 Tax=Rhodophyticola sp. CCM32 TaxID=2916397 RepID=UPI00107F35CF|nr:DUF1523 family protein [Rhodophyticola sp. CCM32]QBY01520.1 DUF1523 family protein [Rhodophyticola sp. CCM32]
MRWPRIIFLSVLLLFLIAFFHYTLPQRDVVQITGTDVIRTDFSRWNRLFYAQSDSGTVDGTNRDLRQIFAQTADDRDIVYRNEDTGFGWPPYFKLNSADLQARATNLSRADGRDQWVVVTHYGWRSTFLTAFPNAVRITPIDNPDDLNPIPWLNIIILALLALALFFIWRMWVRFEDRVIDPAVDRVSVRWAKMRDWMAGRR